MGGPVGVTGDEAGEDVQSLIMIKQQESRATDEGAWLSCYEEENYGMCYRACADMDEFSPRISASNCGSVRMSPSSRGAMHGAGLRQAEVQRQAQKGDQLVGALTSTPQLDHHRYPTCAHWIVCQIVSNQSFTMVPSIVALTASPSHL